MTISNIIDIIIIATMADWIRAELSEYMIFLGPPTKRLLLKLCSQPLQDSYGSLFKTHRNLIGALNS